MYDKNYFRAFRSKDEIVQRGLRPFLAASQTCVRQLARSFANKLSRVEAWFQRQRRYAYISSSLLFVYDAQPFQRSVVNGYTTSETNGNSDHAVKTLQLDVNFDEVCDVRMIDFAHVSSTDSVDLNYLGGLQSLLALFHDIANTTTNADC